MTKTTTTETSGARQKAHNGVDRIMDKADSMRESSKQAMNRIKEKAITVRKNVDGSIRKHPKKSVAIAAGIGAVVGGTVAAVMMRKKGLR